MTIISELNENLVEGKKETFVSALIERGALSSLNEKDLWEALYMLCDEKLLSSMDVLAQQGFSINVEDDNGMTVLDQIAEDADPDTIPVIIKLLELGARVSPTTKEHLASFNDDKIKDQL